jgi:dTMP kinase
MASGKYIVIEGNDGTGKSTQVELLAAWLRDERGIETITTHEPAGAPIANAIRDVIKNGNLERDGETNLLLFTAARHEIWNEIKPELEAGKWVISARNYISTLVYQGYAEGIDLDKIRRATLEFTDEHYINPDFTFVLSLPHAERERRITQRGELKGKDTFESRNREFQEKLNFGYEEIAKEYDFPLLDASKSIDDIQAEIRQLINAV